MIRSRGVSFKQNKEFIIFNIFETINRVLGIFSTFLLSRILTNSLGEFLYYQSIYTLMAAVAMFSTEYVNLVKYKTDSEYIKSDYFLSVIQVRFILTLIVLLVSIILNLHFNTFSFLPYSIALLIISVVSFDFILLSERKLLYYGCVRFLSQLSNIVLLLLFYHNVIDKFFITYSQLIQIFVMSSGVFVVAIVIMKKQIPWKKILIFSKYSIVNTFGDIGKFFVIKQFIIFIGGVDLIILSYYGFNVQRDLFAEGQRLSYISYPFIAFYISYSLSLISTKHFIKQLFFVCIFLLCLSPIYTTILFGKTSSINLMYYNFFIILIFFQSTLDKENTETLINDSFFQNSLSKFNIKYFFISTVLISGIYTIIEDIDILYFIGFFNLKLIIYLIIYNIRFKIANSLSVLYIILIAILNLIFYYTTYYKLLFNLCDQIIGYFLKHI